MNFLIIILSYFLGSVNFAYIAARIKGIDISSSGSGNPGTSNVLRTLGKGSAAIVLIGDLLKGAIPVIFFSEDQYFLLYGVAAVLGHIYPVFYKFKGGKGVATYVGILFSLNIYFGILFIVIWFITFLLFKFSSLSSLIASISIPVYLLILSQFNHAIFFTIMFVLIFFTHRENIKRLKNKEETKTKIY